MKFIKIVVFSLVGILAVITIVGFLSPANVHVERSVEIKATPEVVQEQVNNLHNWTKWSPWYKKDTAAKMEYNDIAAGTGASMKWDSKDSQVGKGDMTITACTKDSITLALNFMENGTANANFIIVPTGTGTKLSWTMDNDMGMNPFGRVFGLLMDKMIGPDFEAGLKGIKEVAEAVPTGPKMYRGYEVKEEDAAEKVYIMHKDSITWDSIETFCQKHTPAIFEALTKAKMQPAGPACSLYFKWDSVTHTAVMAVAVPVVGDAKTKVKGYETVVLPASKNLHIVYLGGYSKIGNAHYAMDDYMKEKNFLQGTPVIEEYVVAPDKESDSTKWITNIFYRVK